jgi:ethanolamine transporter
MSFSEGIVWVLMICMLLGAADRALGNKFGLGQKFEEGFNSLGPLALSMVGIISIAPVIAKLAGPLIVPIYKAMGADPAMFAGSVIASDMGGYQLAQTLAASPDGGAYGGLITGAMLGCTVAFTIPVGLGLIQAADRRHFALGVLIGIVTIPFGVLVGGLIAGFNTQYVLQSLVPVFLFSALIAFGLWKWPERVTNGFFKFGKGIVAVASVGLAIAVFEWGTKVKVMPAGWELTPAPEGLAVVATIGMMLLGAFPFVVLISKVFASPLRKLGGMMKMDEAGATGLLAQLANSIPMLATMKDMNIRGKVINSAFAVSGAFALGDHLGFTAAVAPDMVGAVVAAKLAAGVTAVALAIVVMNLIAKHSLDATATPRPASVFQAIPQLVPIAGSQEPVPAPQDPMPMTPPAPAQPVAAVPAPVRQQPEVLPAKPGAIIAPATPQPPSQPTEPQQ